MSRDEAQARCDELNREHPDRTTYRWFPRKDGSGDWVVARVAVGPLAGPPTGVVQPEKPQPPDATPGQMPGGVQPWAAGG
jgi:hypothetical protein